MGGGGSDQTNQQAAQAALAAVGQRANQAAAAAAALATPVARRIAEAVAGASGGNSGRGGRDSSRGRSGKGDRSGDGGPTTGFGFLDNMCGPVLQKFGGDGNDRDDDLADEGGRRRPGRRGNPRRLVGSYDQDDETYVTDATGSYDDYDDDGTYESSRAGGRSNRGRDRRPRGGTRDTGDASQIDSPSEMTGMTGPYSEFDDETTRDGTATEASASYTPGTAATGAASMSTDGGPGKLIAQPLASGFARRCYFTKAGIGRSTQHYEGLTLTGNTVLMLAGAMRLKGCPTICDEDLRRVETTYPNQFSRLPDELLLSSGWRRISKYCHFSGRPLPDGVPFFHSRRRCHPGGGYYFLLCSAVGMSRLMDVEPLGRDALAVLQTDFPTSCERCPEYLMGEPSEWTLVNKFCFFSGGPINTDEDVFYRAELGGSEIYMLAFLSPSLSPEELYRLRPPAAGADGQPPPATSEPLGTVAAVEEVESVYDLTERDFDDLKLYHLGPCRALPPFLLHPEAWTKVLPPHFVAAREEALRKAYELEGRSPPDEGAAAGGEMSQQQESAYVELQGGAPPTPAESAMMGGVAPPGPGGYPGDGGPGGGYPPQYPQQGGSPYGYPPPGGPGGYPQQQHVGGGPGEMDYYYDGSGQGSVAPPGPGQGHPQYPPPQGGRMMPPQYDSPSRGPHPPPHYHHPGQHPQYGSPSHPYGPGPGMPPPYHGGWQRDVHEEGAFGNGVHHLAGGGMHGSQSFGNGPIGEPGPVDSPHDEAMYMQHVGGHHSAPQDPGYGAHYQQHPQGEDPPGGASVASGAGSALMDRAGDRLRQKRAGASPSRRPDLSSKLEPQQPGGEEGDESTFDDTRTDAESSYGTSLVSGTSSYTDTTAGERSSRRALILQMAKARMKSGRGAPGAGIGAGTGRDPGAPPAGGDPGGVVPGLELD